jgi:hypothetical protein
MKRRSTLVASILLALTFSIGAFSGMALEEALGIDWFEFLDRSRDRSDDALLEGLGLSAEQKTEAEKILEQREEDLESYWEKRLPEIGRIVGESNARIRLILTPEQQATFDSRVRSLDGGLPREARER